MACLGAPWRLDSKSILHKHIWERWCVCGGGDEENPHQWTQIINSTRSDSALRAGHVWSYLRRSCQWALFWSLLCWEPPGSPLESICHNCVRPQEPGDVWVGRVQGQATQLQLHLVSCPHCPWRVTAPSFAASSESTSFFHLQGLWSRPSKSGTCFCLDGAGLPWWPCLGHLPDSGVAKGEVWKLKMLILVPKDRCTVFMDMPGICASPVEACGVKMQEYCAESVSPKQRTRATSSSCDVFGRSLDLA